MLVRQLLRASHRARVADVLYAGGESIIDLLGYPDFEFTRSDAHDADAMRKVADGADPVVYLTVVVSNPVCA